MRYGIAVVVVTVLCGASPAVAQQMRLGIDGPMGDVTNPIGLCGFAVDLDARPRPGIASVVATFSTPTGPIVVPATLGFPRPDIAAAYHVVQDANVGWCLPPQALPPGVTVVTVRALSDRWSAPDGRPLGAQRDWTLCQGCTLFSWINTPKQGQVVPQAFTMTGVARDFSGAGVWLVRVFALDRSRPHELPTLLGYAQIGLPRPEPAWDGYGWVANVTLPPGTYDLITEAWSQAWQVETRVVRVVVGP